MISKLLRVLLTIAILGVVALVVINHRSYNSMIPAEYNFIDRLFEKSTEVPQEQPTEAVIEVDSLEVEQEIINVDTLNNTQTEAVDS
ncbi:MAG: hypothetical protein SNI51_00540 [Rikenellaceae bacterium]